MADDHPLACPFTSLVSIREIELLAHGYFRSTSSLREAIDQGNWKWTLQQMQEVAADPESLSDFERSVLRELERLLSRNIRHLIGNAKFAEGDWNLDGDFDSADLVFAFQTGHYQTAAWPLTAEIAAAVDWLFVQRDDATKSRVFVA